MSSSESEEADEQEMRKAWSWMEDAGVGLGEFVDKLVEEYFLYEQVQGFDSDELKDCFETIGLVDEQQRKIFKSGLDGTLQEGLRERQLQAEKEAERQRKRELRRKAAKRKKKKKKMESPEENISEEKDDLPPLEPNDLPALEKIEKMEKPKKKKEKTKKKKASSTVLDARPKTLKDLFVSLKINLKYLESFEENDVSISNVKDLSTTDLEELIDSVIHRKKLQKYIASVNVDSHAGEKVVKFTTVQPDTQFDSATEDMKTYFQDDSGVMPEDEKDSDSHGDQTDKKSINTNLGDDLGGDLGGDLDDLDNLGGDFGGGLGEDIEMVDVEGTDSDVDMIDIQTDRKESEDRSSVSGVKTQDDLKYADESFEETPADVNNTERVSQEKKHQYENSGEDSDAETGADDGQEHEKQHAELPFKWFTFVATHHQEWHNDFVMKPLVPRVDVVRLCEAYAEHSVRDSGSKINFDILNQQEAQVFGFFGGNSEIQEILQSFLKLDDSLKKPLKNWLKSLREGIYGIKASDECLVLFYRAGEDCFKNIHRESRCVLYLRYLVELSRGSVVFLLNDKEIKDLKEIAEIGSDDEGAGDVYKLTTVQDASYEFLVYDGFSVKLPRSIMGRNPNRYMTVKGTEVPGYYAHYEQPSQISWGRVLNNNFKSTKGLSGFLDEHKPFDVILKDGIKFAQFLKIVEALHPEEVRTYNESGAKFKGLRSHAQSEANKNINEIRDEIKSFFVKSLVKHSIEFEVLLDVKDIMEPYKKLRDQIMTVFQPPESLEVNGAKPYRVNGVYEKCDVDDQKYQFTSYKKGDTYIVRYTHPTHFSWYFTKFSSNKTSQDWFQVQAIRNDDVTPPSKGWIKSGNQSQSSRSWGGFQWMDCSKMTVKAVGSLILSNIAAEMKEHCNKAALGYGKTQLDDTHESTEDLSSKFSYTKLYQDAIKSGWFTSAKFSEALLKKKIGFARQNFQQILSEDGDLRNLLIGTIQNLVDTGAEKFSKELNFDKQLKRSLKDQLGVITSQETRNQNEFKKRVSQKYFSETPAGVAGRRLKLQISSISIDYCGTYTLYYRTESKTPTIQKFQFKRFLLSANERELLEDASLRKQKRAINPRAEPHKVLKFETIKGVVSDVYFLKKNRAILIEIELDKSTIHFFRPSSALPTSYVVNFTIARTAFDETSRRLVVYSSETKMLFFFQFDISYAHIYPEKDKTEELPFVVKAIHFLQGKNEVCIIDGDNVARILDATTSTFKEDDFKISSDFQHSLISPDGSFLLTFTSPVHGSGVELRVYLVYQHDDHRGINTKVGDIVSSQKLHRFDSSTIKTIQLQRLGGKQLNLIGINRGYKTMKSYIVDTKNASARTVLESDSIRSDSSKEAELLTKMDYFYFMMEKFPVKPPFRSSGLEFGTAIAVHQSTAGKYAKRKKMVEELESIQEHVLTRLSNQTTKKVRSITWNQQVCTIDELPNLQPQNVTPIGDFVRTLITLVPLQIARADSGEFILMHDGLEGNEYDDCADLLSYHDTISFGLYDAVFDGWNGEVRTVSSMGMQSSGKSYTLNHMSGTLFDVSGKACTDGIWMSVRFYEECLYVMMDFEGLGTRNTAEEDMLLSVFNAAIANLTIYKCEKVLSKDVRAMFDRFQSGIDKIKGDKKLFNGRLLLHINNCQKGDRKSVKQQYRNDITDIIHNTPKHRNFLDKMYGGNIVVQPLLPIAHDKFYDEFKALAKYAEESIAQFKTGGSFIDRMKLLMAKMRLKDYQPLDVQIVKLRVQYLSKFIDAAIKNGTISDAGDSSALVNLETNKPIQRISIASLLEAVHDAHSDKPQSDLFSTDHIQKFLECSEDPEFSLSGSDDDFGVMFQQFHRICKRTHKNASGEMATDYPEQFQAFQNVLLLRRELHVNKWIDENAEELEQSVSHLVEFRMKVSDKFGVLKQQLVPCKKKCSKCEFKCLLPSGHRSSCNCLSDDDAKDIHVCLEECLHCNQGQKLQCGIQAGHQGSHDCRDKPHTCSQACALKGLPGCGRYCALQVNHPDEEAHSCQAQHRCGYKCDLPSCLEPCSSRYEEPHDKHECGNTKCLNNCETNTREACVKLCSKGHFHDGPHDCEQAHRCALKCQIGGNCEVSTREKLAPTKFKGKLGEIVYTPYSECRGYDLPCILDHEHDGICMCEVPGEEKQSEASKNRHTCMEKCELCGYFCQKMFEHKGPCAGPHGNMRHGVFVSNVEEIDISGYKLARGDGAEVIQSCDLFCESRGQGHLHVVVCNNDAEHCPPEANRKMHSNVKIEGHQLSAVQSYDLVTHDHYWKTRGKLQGKKHGWEDPVSNRKIVALFNQCSHKCAHKAHADGQKSKESSDGKEGEDEDKYCLHEVLHEPLSVASKGGYLSVDKHEFTCQHEKPLHILLVIDRSGSMCSDDITPRLKYPNMRNRLGCVYETCYDFLKKRVNTSQGDIITMILFGSDATTVFERQPLRIDLEKHFTTNAGGGTNFAAALQMAKTKIRPEDSPAIIFLSDGHGGDATSIVSQIKAQNNALQFHAVHFGDGSGGASTLQKMSKAASINSFNTCKTGVELRDTFGGLASISAPIFDVQVN